MRGEGEGEGAGAGEGAGEGEGEGEGVGVGEGEGSAPAASALCSQRIEPNSLCEVKDGGWLAGTVVEQQHLSCPRGKQ